MAGYFDNLHDYISQMDSVAISNFTDAQNKLSSNGIGEFSYLNLKWDGSNILRKSDNISVFSLDARDRLELYKYLTEFFIRVEKKHFYNIT